MVNMVKGNAKKRGMRKEPLIFKMKQTIIPALIGGVLVGAIVFLAKLGGRTSEGGESVGGNSGGSSTLKRKLEALKTCKISSLPKGRENWDTKPLWFAEFPDSFDQEMIRDLIKHLTGAYFGGKQYVIKTKFQNRCISKKSETVACFTVHPVVDIKPPPESPKKAGKYGNSIVLMIRNPATSIPIHDNSKAIKYRKHPKGTQILEADWKAFRDEYFKKTMDMWSTFYSHWISVSKDPENTLGEFSETKKGKKKNGDLFFLSYERLMDERTGPGVLRGLAALLRNEGFQTVSDSDMKCVWYTAIGEEKLMNYHEYNYEYSEYIPSYTTDQKNYLLTELQKFQDTKADKKNTKTKNEYVLDQIINEYYNEISDNTVTD